MLHDPGVPVVTPQTHFSRTAAVALPRWFRRPILDGDAGKAPLERSRERPGRAAEELEGGREDEHPNHERVEEDGAPVLCPSGESTLSRRWMTRLAFCALSGEVVA